MRENIEAGENEEVLSSEGIVEGSVTYSCFAQSKKGRYCPLIERIPD